MPAATLFSAAAGHPYLALRLPNGGVRGKSTGHCCGATQFRWAFQDAGFVWTEALCRADTDGDGQTNGLELGDPCCVWTGGDDVPEHTSDVSLAGSSASTTSRLMPDCAWMRATATAACADLKRAICAKRKREGRLTCRRAAERRKCAESCGECRVS